MKKILMFLALLSACTVQTEIKPVEEKVFNTPQFGTLSGTLGPIENFTTATSNIHYTKGEDTTYLEGNGYVEDKAVMVFLTTSKQNLFTVGTTDFTIEDQDLNLVGCVGQELNTYDIYDQSASFTTVTVEQPDDDYLTVDIVGSWQLNGEYKTSTFSFRVYE